MPPAVTTAVMKGPRLHEVPLKKLPRLRSSSVSCDAPSWATSAASVEGRSTGEVWTVVSLKPGASSDQWTR